MSKLQSADSNKQDLESRLNEMMRANAQLKLEVSTERQKYEDIVSRLESELENVKERVQEKSERQVDKINEHTNTMDTILCMQNFSHELHLG